MSINARVVLLVGYDKTMYTMATNVSMKRWTLTLPKFDEPFGVRSILKDFWEPMSVNVRVVLLVEDYTTLHTMATSVSTKR